MVVVKSQAELKSAMARKEKHIRIEGPFAKELYNKIQKRKKIRKGALISGGVLALGGLLAAPFTGGGSLLGSATGLSMMGFTAATVGSITITTAELAIICGTGIAFYAIYKGAKIKFHYNQQTGEVVCDINR